MARADYFQSVPVRNVYRQLTVVSSPRSVYFTVAINRAITDADEAVTKMDLALTVDQRRLRIQHNELQHREERDGQKNSNQAIYAKPSLSWNS